MVLAVEPTIHRKDREHAIRVREYLDELYRPAVIKNGKKFPGPWQTCPKRMLRHKSRKFRQLGLLTDSAACLNRTKQNGCWKPSWVSQCLICVIWLSQSLLKPPVIQMWKWIQNGLNLCLNRIQDDPLAELALEAEFQTRSEVNVIEMYLNLMILSHKFCRLSSRLWSEPKEQEPLPQHRVLPVSDLRKMANALELLPVPVG